MSFALQKLEEYRKTFAYKSEIVDVKKILTKITNILNNLALGNLPDSPPGTKGGGFATLTGGELAQYQMKFSGYKFYLADIIANLHAHSKYLEAYLKDYRAREWNRVKDEITAAEGKVKNVDLIKNELTKELWIDTQEQILYESEYQRTRLKSLALDNIITLIVQQISALKRQVDQANI